MQTLALISLQLRDVTEVGGLHLELKGIKLHEIIKGVSTGR